MIYISRLKISTGRFDVATNILEMFENIGSLMSTLSIYYKVILENVFIYF